MPCDREFAVIERMKRKKDAVEIDWPAMTATKFATVAVTSGIMQDYKGHFDRLFKKGLLKRKKSSQLVIISDSASRVATSYMCMRQN